MTLIDIVRTHHEEPGVRFKHPETKEFCYIDSNGRFIRSDGLFDYLVVLDLTDLIRDDWFKIS